MLAVDTLIQLLAGRCEAILTEIWPEPDRLVVSSPEGAFVHELIVPLTRIPAQAPDGAVFARSQAEPLPAAPPTTPAARSIERSFSSGSEWLYAKLYCGPATADRLLRELVGPLKERLLGHVADRWHFLRLGDPEWHLRIRFHGDPARLVDEVLPSLQDPRVWRLQLDTYVREVERYGGPAAIELVEAIFHVDSDAALAIIGAVEPGAKGLEERRHLALGRSAPGCGPSARLARLLARADAPEDPLSPGYRIHAHRSERLGPLVAGLTELERAGELITPIERVAADIIHMFVNRLLRSAHRGHELVVCDALLQLRISRAAREGGG